MKMNDSLETRLKSEEIDKRIRGLKRRYQNENILKRNNIIMFEEKQRQAQVDHYKEKVASIHSQIDRETQSIMRKRKDRQD